MTMDGRIKEATANPHAFLFNIWAYVYLEEFWDWDTRWGTRNLLTDLMASLNGKPNPERETFKTTRGKIWDTKS